MTGFLIVAAIAVVLAYLLMCFGPPWIAHVLMHASERDWAACLIGGAVIYFLVQL
jgi:hypothetical protein